jgi:Holliday junction resolvasome RuvABC DNA-binding subunit
MTQTIKELQRIKGIGPTFAQRFLEAGYDTFSKIAAAGEEGLRNIRGINAQMVQSILTQAKEMVGEVDKTRTEKVEELKQRAASVMNQVQDIAQNVHKRFPKEAVGKKGKKVKKEIAKILTSLEKTKGQIPTKVKRTSRALVKVEKRLAGLMEAGFKGLGKGLRKTRKLIQKNFPQ